MLLHTPVVSQCAGLAQGSVLALTPALDSGAGRGAGSGHTVRERLTSLSRGQERERERIVSDSEYTATFTSVTRRRPRTLLGSNLLEGEGVQ